MKSQVLHTVWCNISGEAAGEIWHWSLLGVKGLILMSRKPESESAQQPPTGKSKLSLVFLLSRSPGKGGDLRGMRRVVHRPSTYWRHTSPTSSQKAPGCCSSSWRQWNETRHLGSQRKRWLDEKTWRERHARVNEQWLPSTGLPKRRRIGGDNQEKNVLADLYDFTEILIFKATPLT